MMRKNDTEENYRIKTYGIWWGERVLIVKEENGKYLVGTSERKYAEEKLRYHCEDFKEKGKCYYEGRVKALDNIFEEKEIIGECRIFKNGRYALYGGNEFKIGKDEFENDVIDDETSEDKDGAGVDISDAEEIYEIKTYGNIMGEKVSVIKEKDGDYLIRTKDIKTAEKTGLERINENYFEGWVSVKIAKIFEEREIIGECKEIKSGWYAYYKGNKFKLSGDMNGNDLIWTKDKSIIDDTIEDTYNSGVFGKIIEYSELEEIYRIDTYVMINGEKYKFYVEKEKGEEYLIGTGNREAAEKLQFEEVDRRVFEKWIPKKDVRVFEIKEVLKH